MFNSLISDYEMKAIQDNIRREVKAAKAYNLKSNGKSLLEKVRAVMVLFLAM
jgi:hypothetical protein